MTFFRRIQTRQRGGCFKGYFRDGFVFFGYIPNRDSRKLTASLALKFMDGWFRRFGFLFGVTGLFSMAFAAGFREGRVGDDA